MCLYANFQFSRWSRDHFSAPFRDKSAKFLVTDSLDKQKAHLQSLGFSSVPLVWVKPFPVGCAQDSRKYPNSAENAVFGSSSVHATKIRNFPRAPVLTSTLTVCRRNPGDPSLYIGPRVRYKYYKRTVVLVWPGSAHAPISV